MKTTHGHQRAFIWQSGLYIASQRRNHYNGQMHGMRVCVLRNDFTKMSSLCSVGCNITGTPWMTKANEYPCGIVVRRTERPPSNVKQGFRNAFCDTRMASSNKKNIVSGWYAKEWPKNWTWKHKGDATLWAAFWDADVAHILLALQDCWRPFSDPRQTRNAITEFLFLRLHTIQIALRNTVNHDCPPENCVWLPNEPCDKWPVILEAISANDRSLANTNWKNPVGLCHCCKRNSLVVASNPPVDNWRMWRTVCLQFWHPREFCVQRLRIYAGFTIQATGSTIRRICQNVSTQGIQWQVLFRQIWCYAKGW